MCSVHKTAIPESYRKFKNSLLFVGNWNVTECFTADGLFAEMHQLPVEAEAEYYPLFSMELFGWYRSAPRAAEWGKDTVEKLYGKNKKTSPRRWCLCSTTAVTINLCRWLFMIATKAEGRLLSGKAGSQNYWSLRTEFEPGESSTLKSLAINTN